MLLSITPISVGGLFRNEGWDLERFVNFCAEEGADGVDFLHHAKYPLFWKNPQRESAAIPGWLAKAGLKIAAYATGNNFTKSAADERRAEVEIVKDALRAAAELGAPVLRIFGGYHESSGGEPGIKSSNGLEMIARCIEECLGEAEACGVVMAIENHGALPGHAYEIAGLIRIFDSEYLKCTFDCANFMGANMDEVENPLHAFEILKGDIAHVHVKDVGASIIKNRQRQAYVTGTGQVPLRQLAAALEDSGYTGYCSLEYEVPEVPAEHGIRKSMEFLRELRDIQNALKDLEKRG